MLSFVSERKFWVDIPVEMFAQVLDPETKSPKTPKRNTHCLFSLLCAGLLSTDLTQGWPRLVCLCASWTFLQSMFWNIGSMCSQIKTYKSCQIFHINALLHCVVEGLPIGSPKANKPKVDELSESGRIMPLRQRILGKINKNTAKRRVGQILRAKITL